MVNVREDNRKPLRVAVYCRVSTEDQAESGTIENQVQFAKSYCELYGIEIHDWYLDEGVSGTIPFDQRLEGNRLLADADRKLFDQMLHYRLDRLGRSAFVIFSAFEALKSRCITLKSMTEPFDTSSPFGEFVMGILAMVAGYERASILERTMQGKRRKVREGYWVGGQAPLGYKKVRDLDNSGRVNGVRLEIDEEGAEVVRLIFRIYTQERIGIIHIAERLNVQDVPTAYRRRGVKGPHIKANAWDPTRVSNILKNETYAGVYHWTQAGKDPIEHKVPSVVERSTWEEAQRLLQRNWEWASRNAKRDYLLRGLLYCGVCGRRYVGAGHHKRKAFVYRCSRAGCPSPKVNAGVLEELVWDDISGFVENPGPVLELIRHKLQAETVEDTESELHQVEKAITSIMEERQTIVYLLRKKRLSEAEADAQLVSTMRELDILKGRKQTLEARQLDSRAKQAYLLSAEGLLERLSDSVHDADPHIKRDVMTTLVSRIAVNPGEDESPNIEIKYLFGTIACNDSPEGRFPQIRRR